MNLKKLLQLNIKFGVELVKVADALRHESEYHHRDGKSFIRHNILTDGARACTKIVELETKEPGYYSGILSYVKESMLDTKFWLNVLKESNHNPDSKLVESIIALIDEMLKHVQPLLEKANIETEGKLTQIWDW